MKDVIDNYYDFYETLSQVSACKSVAKFPKGSKPSPTHSHYSQVSQYTQYPVNLTKTRAELSRLRKHKKQVVKQHKERLMS